MVEGVIQVVQIPLREWNEIKQILKWAAPLLKESKEPWIPAKAAMQLLGCKRTKLWELTKRGEIVYKTLGSGRSVRYSRASIEAFNKANSFEL